MACNSRSAAVDSLSISVTRRTLVLQLLMQCKTVQVSRTYNKKTAS